MMTFDIAAFRQITPITGEDGQKVISFEVHVARGVPAYRAATAAIALSREYDNAPVKGLIGIYPFHATAFHTPSDIVRSLRESVEIEGTKETNVQNNIKRVWLHKSWLDLMEEGLTQGKSLADIAIQTYDIICTAKEPSAITFYDAVKELSTTWKHGEALWKWYIGDFLGLKDKRGFVLEVSRPFEPIASGGVLDTLHK